MLHCEFPDAKLTNTAMYAQLQGVPDELIAHIPAFVQPTLAT